MLRHLLLLALFTAASSQQTLSSTSPVTRTLSRPPYRAPTDALVTLVHQISRVIDTRIENNDSQACNLRVTPWLDLQIDDLDARGLGTVTRTCQSRLHLADAVSRAQLPGDFLPAAEGVLRAGARALGGAAGRFAQAELAWGDVFPITAWEILKGRQTCLVESATAYRLHDVWYVRGAVTNRPVDAFQPEGRRLYVEELLCEDLTHALVTTQDEDGVLVNGTTVLRQRGGKAGFSSVQMGDVDNPALIEALRLNALAVDQAADAVTPSNIAILALPMVMALIPVAFIAELNTLATFLYIVFTDVFSALPFLIKGVELVGTGATNRGELVAYHLGNSTLGVMEIWLAECHGEDGFRHLGIVFCVIATGVVVMGVSLEYLAWRWMKRNGRLGHSPFGEVLVMNRYTVFERTVDDDDDDEIVEQGRRRWRIRRIRRRRNSDDGLN